MSESVSLHLALVCPKNYIHVYFVFSQIEINVSPRELLAEWSSALHMEVAAMTLIIRKNVV